MEQEIITIFSGNRKSNTPLTGRLNGEILILKSDNLYSKDDFLQMLDKLNNLHLHIGFLITKKYYWVSNKFLAYNGQDLMLRSEVIKGCKKLKLKRVKLHV